MNELNPTNAFGELLLDLIEAQYDGDFDSGIMAIMESTGLTEEEVTAIVSGETIVEDENLLSGIIDAFPDADEDDLEVIIQVATAVDEEDRENLLNSLDEDEAAMGEDMGEEEPEMAAAAYNQYYGNHANFNGYGVSTRINSIENKIAEFEYNQYVQTLKNRLSNIDFMASQAVNAEILPASYKTMLIGNFNSEDDRLARFSQISAENGVDINTQLYATEFALGLLTDASDFVEFKDYSISDDERAVANFSASLDQIVQNDVQAIFSDSLLNNF